MAVLVGTHIEIKGHKVGTFTSERVRLNGNVTVTWDLDQEECRALVRDMIDEARGWPAGTARASIYE